MRRGDASLLRWVVHSAQRGCLSPKGRYTLRRGDASLPKVYLPGCITGLNLYIYLPGCITGLNLSICLPGVYNRVYIPLVALLSPVSLLVDILSPGPL